MGAIRLNRRAMEWGFPWTAAIHPVETEPNGDVTRLCVGLPAVRPLSCSQQLHGEACSCR